MTSAFKVLHGYLDAKYGTTEDDLFKALQLIRAHSSLAGIQMACARLVDLKNSYPDLAHGLPYADANDRFNTLNTIAQDTGLPTQFTAISPAGFAATPFVPYTGDSGLCDLLLIKPQGSNRSHDEQFDQLVRWFAWQIVQYQHRVQSSAQYRDYLEKGTTKLKDVSKNNGRVYRAYLKLRSYADPSRYQDLIQLNQFLGSPTQEDSLKIAFWSAYSRLTSESRKFKWAVYWNEHIGTEWNSPQSIPTDSGPVALFLELIWANQITEIISRKGGHRGSFARRVIRPRVEIWGNTQAEVSPVHHQSLWSGTAVDFRFGGSHGTKKRKDLFEINDDGEEEDPDQYESPEPDLRLFLGTADPIKGFYASRSAHHHSEAANALLAWSPWRLSQDAIRKGFELVQYLKNENIHQRRARLTIGLSLLSGRSFEDVSAPRILKNKALELTDTYPIGISLDDMVLHVVCAKPTLKLPVDLEKYCASNAGTLRLPLPEAWSELIHSLEGECNHRSQAVYRHAREFLDKLPSHLGIDEKGISGALMLALLEESSGDRGLVKVITDSASSNMNNLIHYASYRRADVEAIWKKCVEERFGFPLPLRIFSGVADERVGSPHGFMVSKLRGHIAHVKAAYQTALQAGRWDAVFNNLALYLYLMLGLANAGRGTKQPMPAVTSKEWVLVGDKRREDGSTDRLLPYSSLLLEQIRVFRTLVESFSILHPSLSAKTTPLRHVLQMRVIKDGAFVPFQPKFIEKHPALVELPANWARKLVRSEARELSGRFKDAGLGHFVMGRHPWSLYSTFNSQQFRTSWLSLQERLQNELGFELLTVDGLDLMQESFPPTELMRKTDGQDTGHKQPAPKLSDEAIKELIEKVEARNYPIRKDSAASGEIALHVARTLVASWAEKNNETVEEKAECLCEYMRRTYAVPLFVSKPRARHRKTGLVIQHEFAAYACVEAGILPAFLKDLKHLPKPANDEVELGRLLMLAIWRMGLLSKAHLETFLLFVESPALVLGIDDLRIVVLNVRCARTQELMDRTVILEPYAASYLAVERSNLRRILTPFSKMSSRKRDQWLQRALTQYLRSMDVNSSITLKEMTSAARQWVMLGSAPVVASYASGQLFTVDLDDLQLIRLSGRKGYRAGPAPTEVPPFIAVPLEHDDALEGAAQSCGSGFAESLQNVADPDPGVWVRRLQEIRTKKHAEVLLREFAVFSVLSHEAAQKSGRLDRRSKNALSRNISIVGHALLHIAQPAQGGLYLDEVVLQSLGQDIEGHYKDRQFHAAWNALRRFLLAVKEGRYVQSNTAQGVTATPALSDINLGTIGQESESRVSAKIVSAAELSDIRTNVRSVISGIGNPLDAKAADNLLGLVQVSGMRRGEGVMLRSVDAMADLCRIQPYAKFTLKTPASERNVPRALLGDEVNLIIESAQRKQHEKVIDPMADHSANGANFFDEIALVMKRVTEDPSMGPHHLRHTLASRLMLSVMRDPVHLDGVFDEFPWIKDLLISENQMKVLMGNEEGGDHGLQAISTLMGHVHPSTTTKHYIHTFCIALYAFLKQQHPIDILQAFENRVGSRASSYRLQGNTPSQARDHLERHSEKLQASNGRERIGWVRRIEKEIASADTSHVVAVQAATLDLDAPELKFLQRIEGVERMLESGAIDADPANQEIIYALEAIGKIPSGKKGSKAMRHPLRTLPNSTIRLPERLTPGLETANALRLIRYLDNLRANTPTHFEWLMNLWRYKSDAQQGLMRLDAEDIKTLVALPGDDDIIFKVEQAAIAAKRNVHKKCSGATRLRIGFAIKEGNIQKIAINRRSAGAVRWVMTWMALLSTAKSLAK